MFIPEERRKNAAYEFQTSYAAFFSIVWNFYYSSFSPLPACEIRFLQRLRFGLPDATLDLSDFNSDKTKAHVEFTLCHVVARRPIRHFSPVNLCPSYARANSARACSDCLKQLSCMLLLWRFD